MDHFKNQETREGLQKELDSDNFPTGLDEM
jgi:hypothetical protein